jgi:hypothetical protein
MTCPATVNEDVLSLTTFVFNNKFAEGLGQSVSVHTLDCSDGRSQPER